jgi:serine/threonine protein kinase
MFTSSTHSKPAPTSKALPSGTSLQNGAFILREVLGQGGFGITYRGEDCQAGRPVAIKELFSADCVRHGRMVAQDDATVQRTFAAAKARFREQARTLTQLRHLNIVRVHTYFEENATVYLVMELLVGQTLLEKVQNGGALQAEKALSIVETVGGALEAVHRLGLLHLDIKPENIVVTKYDRAVLMDFDLIQKVGSNADFQTRPLQATVGCGTPGYAPLEQYSQSAQLSPATDIYALGATLYHLLTGAPPPAATERVLPPGQDLSLAAFDAFLARGIEHALQVRIEDRPQSVHAFLEELRPVVADTSPSIPSVAHIAIPTPVAAVIPPVPGVQATAQNAAQATVQVAVPAATVQSQSSTQSGVSTGHDRVWRVEVPRSRQPSQYAWPARCACCDAPTPNSAVEVARASQTWRVPHCELCAAHMDSSRTSVIATTWGMIGGTTIALLGVLMRDFFLGPVGVVVYFSAASYGLLQWISAETMTKPTCADKKLSVLCKGGRGTNLLWEFPRAEYADEFRRLNGGRWG